jgi:hypothetical protein
MMNKRILKLAKQAGWMMGDEVEGFNIRLEKFSLLIVYDFLSELSNDDALGEARIATIKRLAKKWGVENERTN